MGGSPNGLSFVITVVAVGFLVTSQPKTDRKADEQALTHSSNLTPSHVISTSVHFHPPLRSLNFITHLLTFPRTTFQAFAGTVLRVFDMLHSSVTSYWCQEAHVSVMSCCRSTTMYG
jgi:hypothetical protein